MRLSITSYMEGTMVSCKACGREVSQDMMFCPYCGKKRAVDQFGRIVEERPERRLGLIPYVHGEGRLAGVWTIIVTDARLIFCKALPTDEISPVRPKSAGLAIMARRDADSGCGVTYALRYHDMSIDDAMAESEANFQIDIKDISSAVLGQKQEGEYHVLLHTGSGPFEFSMPLQHDHRDMLRSVLGPRIRW